MVCEKCGRELKRDEKICSVCNQDQPVNAEENPKKLRIRLSGLIACIVMVVLAAVVVFAGVYLNKTAVKAVDSYANALYEFDMDTLNEYSAIKYENIAYSSISDVKNIDEAKSKLQEEFGNTDINAIFSDKYKDSKYQSIIKKYGPDYELNVQIYESVKLGDLDTEAIFNKFSEKVQKVAEFYGVEPGEIFNVEKIKDIYLVNGSVTVSGVDPETKKKAKGASEVKIYAVRLGMDWVVLTDDFSFKAKDFL